MTSLTPYSSISIVDFEQVDVTWVITNSAFHSTFVSKLILSLRALL